MIDSVIERLRNDYSVDLLRNTELTEKQRLEIIFKLELLDEIENIIKGDRNG